jgi:hypothetical protein
MKAALIRTFPVGLILASYLCAQTFSVEKNKPNAEPRNLYIVGGVNPEPWLQIIRTNASDPSALPGYDPCYTYLLLEHYCKPKVRELKDGRWEITFVSPLGEPLP